MGNRVASISQDDEQLISRKINSIAKDFEAQFAQAYKETLVSTNIEKEKR